MVTKDDGLGDKEGTGGQAPGDAGRPCTEHAAFGGVAYRTTITIFTSRTPTFCDQKELELMGD